MLLPVLKVPPLDDVHNMVCANITHHWHTSAAGSVMAVKIPQERCQWILRQRKPHFIYINSIYTYLKQIHIDKYIFCANRGMHLL